MLELVNISAGYGSLNAIQNIALSIPDGSKLGVFGHNGAGKTTLMRCIIGAHVPSSGEVRWRGEALPQGDVPAIAQQHQRVIAKQLIDYRHAERWDPLMEEVVARHGLSSARDIADVAAYVAAQRRDGARAGTGDGRQVETGARLYSRDCAGCHGADGEGNGVTLVPRLAGQHYKYVLRQLHDTLEQRRPNMPPPHPQLFDPLQVNELTGLADYLARLQPPRRVLTP